MANLNAEIEDYIRKKVSWESLPASVHQQLGNSSREYDKSILQFSIKNQLRYRGNLVKSVRRDERRYYEELIEYSKSHLMLFPYHLSDVVIKGLRLTPFMYYVLVLESIMGQEKSYDSLPNFTAVDCLRLLGIGRNQYIDLMNKTRSKTKFGGFSTSLFKKSIRSLLPAKPVNDITVLPWWVVQVGFVTDDDVKLLTKTEKAIIDQIIDSGPCPAGHLNRKDVLSLYIKGLVYFDIIIDDRDLLIMPPLEGFVMNRVTGDYFETLLYKIFVSLDEHTSVLEMSNLLEIELALVKDAVSLYCRLGFTKKKNAELDSDLVHPSWIDEIERNSVNMRCGSVGSISSDEEDSLLKELNRALESETESLQDISKDDTDNSKGSADTKPTTEDKAGSSKKIGFLFDSTLTAYLMMGNLSPSLKNHAVTMFEVGKLSDESMEVFLAELDKVSVTEADGEAAVYFTAAMKLKDTIVNLRNNSGLKQHDLCLGLDLVRVESLQSLDQSTVSRLLQKNYSLLVSMAPLAHELRALTSHAPPHLGPSLPELASPWFKFFLYSKLGHGPPSLLLPKGYKVVALPKALQDCAVLLVTTWGHEPSEVKGSSVLITLQDALLHSPVLLQSLSTQNYTKAETKIISFPFDKVDEEYSSGLNKVRDLLKLDSMCGFVTLANLERRHTEIVSGESDENEVCDKNVDKPSDDVDPSSASEDKVKENEETDNRQQSPAGQLLTADSELLLTEELDSIDSPMAGGGVGGVDKDGESEVPHEDLGEKEKPGTPLDVASTSSSSVPVSTSPRVTHRLADNWTLMDVTFGVPLFNADLNAEIVQKMLCHDLMSKEVLEHAGQHMMDIENELLVFVRQCCDVFKLGDDVLSRTMGMTSSDPEVPFPTQPVWFDGSRLCPLPPPRNDFDWTRRILRDQDIY